MAAFSIDFVHELCKREGFAASGIAPINSSKFEQEYLDWIDEGKHGEMAWLSNNVQLRMNPLGLLEGAQSLICVLDRYSDSGSCKRSARDGWIARYAIGRDYHKQIKKRLHRICDSLSEVSGETFRACVDTAPLLEREIAASAGLGAIGKNTLLLEQGIGSWFFIGVIVTTAKLTPSEPNNLNPCQSCTKCIDACPTNAITPFSVDATQCISYLTIEHRSEIGENHHEHIGNWLFGCDICQEVCPHNQPTHKSKTAVPNRYLSDRTSFDILEVLNWTEEDRRHALTGSAMKRAKLYMFKRNALIIAGNILRVEDDEKLKQSVIALCEDENTIVQATAKKVLERIR